MHFNFHYANTVYWAFMIQTNIRIKAYKWFQSFHNVKSALSNHEIENYFMNELIHLKTLQSALWLHPKPFQSSNCFLRTTTTCSKNMQNDSKVK